MLMRARGQAALLPMLQGPAWPRYLGHPKAASPSLFEAISRLSIRQIHFFHQIHSISNITAHTLRAGTGELHLSEAEQLLTLQGVTNAKLS